ncbi:MAG: prolipoprotein diacylglyceryl transferase family protein [bacterium]
MLPILFSLGPVKIYSMGVLMFLGLLLGLYYWWKLGRDEHWDEIALFDAYFLGFFIFLLVGRLGYVIMHWSDLGTVYRFFAFLAYPGIMYSWGILGSIIGTIAFVRDKNWDLWKVFDVLVIVLSILILFGSIGAFLNGSNPGKEVSWGVSFPGSESRYIPVDLWGVIWGVASFITVARVRKNFRFYSWYKGVASLAKDGLATLIFGGLTGVYYLIRAFLDDSLSKLGRFPIMGLIGVGLVIIAAYLIYVRSGTTIEWDLLQSKLSLILSKRHKRRGGKL